MSQSDMWPEQPVRPKDTHTDNEELRSIFARHGVYDGKTSLYFQREVDDFVRDVAQYIHTNHTPQAAVQGDEPNNVYSWVNDTHDPLFDTKQELARLFEQLFFAPRKRLSKTERLQVTNATNHITKFYLRPNKATPTKSSGELEEILDVIGYTPNLDSRAFAKEAIESYVATQTTKLQAEARIDELKIMKRYSEQHITKQSVHAVHDDVAKGSTLAMVPLVHINDRIEHLEREHKIGEDGEQ